jgi:two-component system, cell cycle response regulator
MNEFLGTRVLVVDDDRLIREMTCDALIEEGFEVASASSGGAALEKLRVDGPFDIVITDLSMREMDGLELMESIRRAHSKTDVIILTGYASLESALQAMRLGAADYLRKPVAPPEIIYAIKRTVIRRSILDENQSLHGFLDTFEAARLLTGCLEACDVLPMLLDILLRVLGRKRAVGRLDLPLPRPGDGVRLVGFEGEDALRLRAALEGGKIFDPRTIEPDDGATAAITEWRGRPDSLADVADPDIRLLALPLRLDGERVGGVWVFGDGEAFVPDDVRRAEVVIAQAELALINAERFIQAREKAFVDDVTELYNARYLMAALDRASSW